MITTSEQRTATTPTTVPYSAYRKERERRLELEQFITWENELFANAALSTSQRLIARSTRLVVLNGKPRDDGHTYVSMEKVATKAGVSISTARRGQQYLEQLGAIERKVEDTAREDGEQRTHVFVKLAAVMATPAKLIPQAPRNHGGKRIPCPSCGSDNIRIQHRLICKDCGNVTILHEHDQESETDPVEQVDVQEKQHPESHALNETEHADSWQQQTSPLLPDEQVDVQGHQTSTSEQNDEQTAPLCVNLTDKVVVMESNLTHRQDTEQPATPPVLVVEEMQTAEANSPTQNTTITKTLTGETTPRDALMEAACLLLSIAGPSAEHVEMNKRNAGGGKYYTVHRTPTQQDMLAHLRGTTTLGALLHHPGAMTRALAWDDDTEEGWQKLKEAAICLTQAGYRILLERSPVGRGGHLWIVFDALIAYAPAYAHLCCLAPVLTQIEEYWPCAGNQKVRLPGGKYVKPGFARWCNLYDANGQLLATYGLEAATALLNSQNPASLIPPTPEPPAPVSPDPSYEQYEHDPSECPQHEAGDDDNDYDGQWLEKYGKKALWFHFTPAQLADWYNAHHAIQEILPPEKNTKGLAHWRGERTASVGYTGDGEGWVDFGASAMRPDGKRDGGDALELQTRVTQEPKAEVMRQAACELVTEARAALEDAAYSNEQPPVWLQVMLTPAGWSHYWKLRKGVPSKQRNHVNQKAVAQLQITRPGVQEDQNITSHEQSVRQVESKDTSRRQQAATIGDTPETLAKELATWLTHDPDHPCETCGCTLTYDLSGYAACARCLPAARRWNAAYQERINALFPIKRQARAWLSPTQHAHSQARKREQEAAR